MMSRDVGVPLARGIDAFGRGDYATAIDRIEPVRDIAHRFGGSHAQRDLVTLTLIEAALRGGAARPRAPLHRRAPRAQAGRAVGPAARRPRARDRQA